MLKLKEIRKLRDKTQDDVANFLNIARPSYANIENGKRDPDTQTLIQLARFFNVSMDMIFGLKSENVYISYPEEQLAEDEKRLISFYRSLNQKNRKAVLTMLESMSGNPASQEESLKGKMA